MNTLHKFDWEKGYTKARRLHRSFNTLTEAMGFASGKDVRDIYLVRGKYRVEWITETKED